MASKGSSAYNKAWEEIPAIACLCRREVFWNYERVEIAMGVRHSYGGNGSPPPAGSRNSSHAGSRYAMDSSHPGNRKYPAWKNMEDDSLIIEDNTIYEVDLDCMECRGKYGGRRR